MIMITDGNSNTRIADSGSCSGTPPCASEITAQRNKLLQDVPGIVTYAIGVQGTQGLDVSTATLNLVSGSSARSFVTPTWESLITNLNTYILGFCQLPDPVQECGSCCGFCECGVCTPPDTPIPVSDFCSGLVVNDVPSAGNCYTTTFNPNPCPPVSCKTLVKCNSSLAQPCVYADVVCDQLNPCFNYACRGAVNGSCSVTGPSGACGVPVAPTPNPTPFPTPAPTTQAPTPAPTEKPTRAPTPPLDVPVELTEEPTGAPTNEPTVAPTEAPTPFPNCTDEGGYYCGVNAVCCEDRVSCCCTNVFTGQLCGLPPDLDECTIASQCFFGLCNTALCQNDGTRNVCVNGGLKTCPGGHQCTTAYCDEIDGSCKTQDVSSKCDDHLQCTIDSCDPVNGCVNAPLDCSGVADVCNDAFCNNQAISVSEACVKESIVCTLPTNCSIAYCSVNESGCVNTTYSCDFGLIGIIAGVTAGVIAGATVAAAFLLAAGMTAGTAAAVSQTYKGHDDSNVRENPLYKEDTKCGEGLADGGKR
jgi:hypothetical protein